MCLTRFDIVSYLSGKYISPMGKAWKTHTQSYYKQLIWNYIIKREQIHFSVNVAMFLYKISY